MGATLAVLVNGTDKIWTAPPLIFELLLLLSDL